MDIFPYKSVKGKVIEYVLDRPNSEVSVTAISRELEISKGHVSEVISSLKQENIIRQGRVNLGNPYVRSLKIAINMNKIVKTGVISLLENLKVEAAGLYGSWAKGTNSEESDIDIWIKKEGDIKMIQIAEFSGKLREALNIQPQVLVLNNDKIRSLKKDNAIFYFSLLLGSMKLIGEGLE